MCPPGKCSLLVWGKTLNWNDQNECLTSSQCYARGGFYYLYYCLTVLQCSQVGRYPYVYGGI